MKIIEIIKKNYAVVSSIMIGITAFIAFSNNIVDFWERFSKPKSEPKLIQFALSESSFGYKEVKTGKFAIMKEFYRTFEMSYPLKSPPSLVLLYTIQNTSSQELFVNSINYNVIEKGQVMSRTPKPLESNKTYSHNLEWTIGTQEKKLIPVYSIPAGMTGTFESEITTPTSTPLGAGLILNIEIHTNLGSLLTDTIQMYLPVSKQIENTSLKDDNLVETSEDEFEKIETQGMAKYEDVISILETSNLKELCKNNNIGQLDIDIMFMKSSYLPFEDYKKNEFKDGTSRKFIDVFPESRLRYFYSSARSYLKEN